jgi:malate synthase
MSERVEISGLQISKSIYNLVTKDIIPGTSLSESDFWHSFAKIIEKFSPINEALLVERENMQQEIDNWHKKNIKNDFSFSDYKKFLQKINYLVPVGSDFSINTSNVDHEITSQAGPQLVVPVMNARFALNAANARWGSLYDSLYGTDVIPNDGKIKKLKNIILLVVKK